MGLKKFLSVPILSVFLLWVFVYYATLYVFIEDWLGLRTSAGSFNTLIFSFLACMCAFSFFVCVLTDPGGVPSGYVPDVERNQGPDQEIHKSRHCDKCSARKPPRAHHCRVCRRCVLKMDHHCIWINNCVGLRNYKPFLVLVFYASVASTYSAIISMGSMLQKDWGSYGTSHLKSFYVGCVLTIVCLSLTFGSLLGWHLYLAAHNMTTIEYHEGKRATWLARKSGSSYHHPFDVGAYKNITLVLGPNMLKWLWPTSVSHIKDGLSFPTARDSS